MKSVISVILAFLPLFTVAAAQPSSVDKLARAAAADVVALATALEIEQWNARSAELVASYPGAAKLKGRWRAGDPHFDAATRALHDAISKWIRDLAAAPQAEEVVMQNFARNLDDANAKKVDGKMTGETGAQFARWCDSMTAGVEFATARADLKVGSPEFSKAYGDFTKRLGVATPNETAELLSVARSAEGTKYSHARSFATTSLARAIDGQVQLLVNDRIAGLGEMVKKEAEACAKGKH